MNPASDLRDLAIWADQAARWLEQTARRPNDDADPMRRTVVFDAATLDEFLTGFRGMSEIVDEIADRLDQRPVLTVISGGRGMKRTKPAVA